MAAAGAGGAVAAEGAGGAAGAAPISLMAQVRARQSTSCAAAASVARSCDPACFAFAFSDGPLSLLAASRDSVDDMTTMAMVLSRRLLRGSRACLQFLTTVTNEQFDDAIRIANESARWPLHTAPRRCQWCNCSSRPACSPVIRAGQWPGEGVLAGAATNKGAACVGAAVAL
jgi:hypothetical protein